MGSRGGDRRRRWRIWVVEGSLPQQPPFSPVMPHCHMFKYWKL